MQLKVDEIKRFEEVPVPAPKGATLVPRRTAEEGLAGSGEKLRRQYDHPDMLKYMRGVTGEGGVLVRVADYDYQRAVREIYRYIARSNGFDPITRLKRDGVTLASAAEVAATEKEAVRRARKNFRDVPIPQTA